MPHGVDPPHGQQHMGMWLNLAVAGRAPMHVQVGHHATRDELLAHEVLRQPHRLGLAQLARQGDLDLASQLAPALLTVPAHFAGGHLVPERLPIQPTAGRSFGQDDLAMDHAFLGQEVLAAAQLLVEQTLARAVGRRRDDPAPLLTADDLGLEVVDRHPELPRAAYRDRTSPRRTPASKSAAFVYARTEADLHCAPVLVTRLQGGPSGSVGSDVHAAADRLGRTERRHGTHGAHRARQRMAGPPGGNSHLVSAPDGPWLPGQAPVTG